MYLYHCNILPIYCQYRQAQRHRPVVSWEMAPFGGVRDPAVTGESGGAVAEEWRPDGDDGASATVNPE